MLVVLSPAKSLDFESPLPISSGTQPEFLDAAANLNGTLRQLSPEDLSELMDISPALGELNFRRNLNWTLPFTEDNARPALFAFTGDVYQGLNARELTEVELDYAQNHVRILSGLYGLLRPLDLIQPYRLEMGTALKHDKHKSLYSFWDKTLALKLREELLAHNEQVLVNLASTEYFKAVNLKALNLPVINPVFKDYKNGQYKIISFYAKRARGSMAAYIIKNRIDHPDGIADFDVDGYRYSKTDSTPDTPVFLRKLPGTQS
ncbi:MAG TPA: peroxide stress protein YaaA [Pseudohongiella sp.]|nr:peroxide stress protein YaaA [Pseudohongiella sp.]